MKVNVIAVIIFCMELLQLRKFCDAAQTENFSLTAKNFDVPTSDISQSIKRLERELGVPLFTRQGNRISVNRRGAELAKSAAQALSLLDRAVSAATDDGECGEISICINTNRRIVMCAVERFKKEYPNISVKTKLFCDASTEDFDLLISADTPPDGYDGVRMLSEKMAIAINRADPLYSDGIDIPALRETPFIAMNESSSIHKLTFELCERAGFKPRIAVQSDDPYYIRKCVELGLGVAIVPMLSWKGQFSDNTALAPIAGCTRDTYAYTNSKRYTSLCTKRFVELLTEVCDNEMRGN